MANLARSCVSRARRCCSLHQFRPRSLAIRLERAQHARWQVAAPSKPDPAASPWQPSCRAAARQRMPSRRSVATLCRGPPPGPTSAPRPSWSECSTADQFAQSFRRARNAARINCATARPCASPTPSSTATTPRWSSGERSWLNLILPCSERSGHLDRGFYRASF